MLAPLFYSAKPVLSLIDMSKLQTDFYVQVLAHTR